MNEKTLQLIKEKNQKYLSALVGKELPEKLVKQLEDPISRSSVLTVLMKQQLTSQQVK